MCYVEDIPSPALEDVMDRNTASIIACCAATAFFACATLITLDSFNEAKTKEAPSLECSVDDTLSFVAFNVTEWDMRGGTLTLTSEEGDKPFVMARTMVTGETCRETFP